MSLDDKLIFSPGNRSNVRKLRQYKTPLLESHNKFIAAYEQDFLVAGLSADFSAISKTGLLNALIKSFGLKIMHEGKDYVAVNVIFPSTAACLDSSGSIGCSGIPVFFTIHTNISNIVSMFHFKSAELQTLKTLFCLLNAKLDRLEPKKGMFLGSF